MRKEIYQNNRIFLILMTIVFICLIIMTICLVNYFYGSKDSTVYGSRLEGIEKVEINEERQTTIEKELMEDEFVETADVRISGKIIYIKMVFTDKAALVDAQSKATGALEKFSEDEKNFYDYHFTLEQKSTDKIDGFMISGAKNVNGTNMVWNNNLKTTEDESADK